MNDSPLQRFESIAQRLVEGSLSRLLGGRLDPLEISAEIARSIESNQHNGSAPNHYQIQLHPTDYTYVRTRWPDVAGELRGYVLKIVRELGLSLDGDPRVELLASPDIQRHFAHIHATFASDDIESTIAFVPIADGDPLKALRDLDAFVIVEGRKHISLDKAQITLGRRTDCDIVLEGRLISRRHAQLRWRFGRFILYDLGSRAGTRVNDALVSEFALRPGDLVQLADVSFIYGEGFANTQAGQPVDEEQFTQPFPRAGDK